jgi:hypothetical protein
MSHEQQDKRIALFQSTLSEKIDYTNPCTQARYKRQTPYGFRPEPNPQEPFGFSVQSTVLPRDGMTRTQCRPSQVTSTLGGQSGTRLLARHAHRSQRIVTPVATQVRKQTGTLVFSAVCVDSLFRIFPFYFDGIGTAT